MSRLTADDYNWLPQTCPICDEPPARFVGKRGGRAHVAHLGVECEIWRCDKCRLIFPNPMPVPKRGLAQHYEVEADDYFKAHDKDVRLSGAERLVQKAESLLGRRGRLLDVGVGRGEVLIAAREAGWECEGVEPSSKFAKYAEERSGVKIWQQAIEDSSIPDKSFDVIILAAVLEHLYNPDIIVGRIAQILRQGGLLYLDVPNEEGLYFKIGNLYQRFRGRDWCVNLAPTFEPFHVFGFSPVSLRKILGKHGLSPVEFKVNPGTSLVQGGSGIVGAVERVASRAVTALSRVGENGTYIETWAMKK